MWSRLAEKILDHPRVILITLLVLTLFLGYWATQVRTDHTAGQFLSSDSQAFREFERASKVFGQSQSVMYIVFTGEDPLEPVFLQQLETFTQKVDAYEGVESVLSLTNVPYLVRQDRSVETRRLYTTGSEEEIQRLRNQPFLRGLLLSEDVRSTAMIVKFEDAFNNSAPRVKMVDRIAHEAEALPGEVALAGFPYLRTQYANRVTAETPLFTFLALLISLFFLYIMFRAWRAVVLPMVIVTLGIIWTIGLVALFGHSLNIVTAILPALIVIIGMATTIHLSTKFFDQFAQHGDLRQALTHTIHSVGLATFLTSLTTAIGFAVLILSGSRLLIVFGQFSSLGIMLLYGIAITLIPVAYIKLRPPSREISSLATHDRFASLFDRLSLFIRHRTRAILVLAVLVSATGIIGITRISSDIYVFSDFYEDDPLRQDLAVFEQNFGGVLPLEVIIEAHKPGQFRSLANLRRIERLQNDLNVLESVGRTFSAADLIKYVNQAYFGGHPATYRLPSNYELPYLQSAIKDLLNTNRNSGLVQNLPTIVDSTFTTTRVFLGVRDIGTSRMNALADTALARTAALFPADEFDTYVTGAAITSTRSGENLVKNLIGSLIAALLIISAIMALLFRSLRLTLISLIPNAIPLLLVGGAMGFAGITLKPSTALIFSLSFGIAVDNAIHFLTKYRMMLQAGYRRNEAVRTTLRETGKAILFASLVLMGGFLVFTLSSFGGTVNMGALTSLTLGTALASNLIILPALIYRFAPEKHAIPPALSMEISGNGLEKTRTENV